VPGAYKRLLVAVGFAAYLLFWWFSEVVGESPRVEAVQEFGNKHGLLMSQGRIYTHDLEHGRVSVVQGVTECEGLQYEIP
jgi:hypothetical protein